MRIGERLRRAMKHAGLNQKTLAQRTHMHEGTISAIMKGTRPNPQWDTVERLVTAIGTTWGDLFEEPRIQLSVKDAALAHEFNDFLARLLANDAQQKQRRRAQSAGEILDRPDRPRLDEVEELPDEPIPEEYDRDGARPYRVLTDAMIGVGIMEGAVIYARPSKHLDAADGEVAIVRLNGRLFLRRVDRRGNQTVLTSENEPRYGEIRVKAGDKFELVAIVVP